MNQKNPSSVHHVFRYHCCKEIVPEALRSQFHLALFVGYPKLSGQQGCGLSAMVPMTDSVLSTIKFLYQWVALGMAKGLKSIGFPSLVYRLLLLGEKINCDRPWKSFFELYRGMAFSSRWKEVRGVCISVFVTRIRLSTSA